MIDGFADLGLSDDDLAVRHAVRQIVAAEIEPLARQVDEDELFPHHGLMTLAEGGFTGILIPEEFGGAGGTMMQYCIAMEEISYACAATAATFMTQLHGVLPILIAGTDEQRWRWLPETVSAQQIAAIAITEPHAGSDVASMSTIALRVDGGYVLNGQKIFITNGNHAGLMTVFARTDPKDRHKGISIFALDLPADGVTFGEPLKKMGIRGSDTATVFFDDVFLEEDRLVGGEGAGFGVAMGALGDARISTAAQAVGIARRAYDTASEYLQAREQFGKPVADFQAVQVPLMDMYSDITAARLMLYQLARYIDARARTEFSVEAAMAKVYCSDIAVRTTSTAVELMGGYGYMREYVVERLARDAKITQIYDGTNAINRLNMARRMRKRAETAG
jgi:alkylation response protein AidB-like acyl-CoA dehydrogenase